MPAASLFHDMETGSNNGNGLEDQRALQLALELSLLGLSNDDPNITTSYDPDARSKKSQNTTECVPVPSSEHVAEIVGRQGCKIKALRAKTNTYIKTPVRGEEPVFVVTGRKEDVCSAKREILSAAEHFSQIRAQRKNNMNGSLGPGPNANIPGQTTIQVRVPYRVVGLVVGPKGATIKRIQQQTNTYIITPSRDKEPIFEVTGLPENVESAKKEIEAHIAMRTGGVIESNSSSNGLDDEDLDPSNDINGADNPFSTGTSFASLYKTSTDPFAAFSSNRDNLLMNPRSQDIFSFNTTGTNKLNDIYSSFTNGFSNGFAGIYEQDEGIAESPTFDAIGSTTTTSTSLMSAFSGVSTTGSTTTSSSPTESLGSVGSINGNGSTGSSGGRKIKRDCIVCFESEVVAALVPCGHNLFCMDCANKVCQKSDAECPVCHQPAKASIRIFS